MGKGVDEQHIGRSEVRLRALITASSEVVYQMSPDWSELLYLQGKDVIPDTDSSNSTWLEKYIHPDDQPRILSVINEAIQTKSIFELEHRVLKVDGSLGWTFSRAVPLLDEHGEIMEWIGTASDITERKKAEEKLRENEDIYRTLLNNTEYGFVVVEPLFDENGRVNDLRYLEANPVFKGHTGLRTEDFLNKRLREALPSIEPHWLERFDQVAKSGIAQRYDNYNKNTNRWYEVVIFPYVDGLLGEQFIDITERKKAEKELLDKQKQLTKELADTKLLQSISTELINEDNTQDLYEKITDVAVKIMQSEYASLQMLDPERGSGGELQLLAFRGFNTQAAEFWEWVDMKTQSTCSEAFRTGRRILVPDVEKCEFMQGTEDQATYLQTGIHAVQTTPLFSRSGKLVGMISTHWRNAHHPSERQLNLLDVLARLAADLIERKLAEEVLRESEQKALDLVAKLEKADQNKNQFISSLSHELRNPLTSMMMSLSLLKLAAPDSEQALQAREILERQTIQLSRLVDDLLEVTRISQNIIKIKKERIELNNLISKTLRDYRQMFAEKGVNLEFNHFPERIYLQTDPSRLTQVIGNLLHNALKFTDKDGRTSVIISKDEANSRVLMRVKDTGLGIKPEQLQELFQPFTQADMSLDRSSGGLGLGLTIVQGMVALLGGSVTAHSEGLGKGSEFIICLPLFAEEVIKEEIKDYKNNSVTFTRRILVIDDIKDVADVICSLLRHLGHDVISAPNGAKGLSLARDFRPDVVFCDIGLPEMNGYEVARNIRKDNELKDVYLIALSGYAQPEDLEKSKEAGFNCHLAKPVDLKKLEEILDQDIAIADYQDIGA